MTGHVALYCRISDDHRTRKRGDGIKAQERRGRAYAAQAWPGQPIVVYSDNDLSASNGVHRPGFAALNRAIAAAEVTHVWCVEQSRLTRVESEWFALAAALDAAGISEVHTDRDGIVRVVDDVAGIKAVLAAGESRRTSRRIRDRMDLQAADGRPSGGRCYGYRHALDEAGRKTMTVVQAEADIIRETADRVLAGWSMARIVADLSARGVRGARGGPVTAQGLRSILRSPTVAGLRMYRGRPVAACWPAILDPDTWAATSARLTGARMVTGGDGRRYPAGDGGRKRRRYLLTGGIAVCAVCGRPLVASTRTTPHGRKPAYWCRPAGCVSIAADVLETVVADRLLTELDTPAFRAALAVDEHAATRAEVTGALARLRTRRERLAAEWAGGQVDDDEWRTARAVLAADETRLRAELAAIPPPAVDVDPDAIRDGWVAMNLDERREVVDLFIAAATVAKATGCATPADRITVVWRGR